MKVRIFAALAAAAVSGSTAAAAAPHIPRLEVPHPCPEAAGFTCSTLVVPLDWRGRAAGTLRLAVAESDNRNAPRGVLVLLAGGPGQAGLPLLGRVHRILAAEEAAYRIVVYDQRGTGAGALRCAWLQAAMGASDLYPPLAEAVRDCARRLGARRRYFGTDDVVADMEALRRALGAPRWVVDGISYGTFVAERYALAHPGRVTGLVLDSVVPHAGGFDLGVAETRATARILRDVCGDSCVANLAAAVHRLHDGPLLLDALTTDSIIDPTFSADTDVPAALASARNGDIVPLEQFLGTMHSDDSIPAEALDQGLHASALCADWRFPWGDSAAPLTRRVAKLRRAVARLRPADLYPFDRDTALRNGFVGQCLPWPPSPPTAAPPPDAKIRVPALLLNGDHDLSTPLEWARQELRLVPRGRLVVVHGAGHSVQSRAVSNAGRAAVASFLRGR